MENDPHVGFAPNQDAPGVWATRTNKSLTMPMKGSGCSRRAQPAGSGHGKESSSPALK